MLPICRRTGTRSPSCRERCSKVGVRHCPQGPADEEASDTPEFQVIVKAREMHMAVFTNRWAVIPGLLMFLAAQSVWAQVAGGSIVGIVTDQSGGAIVGATVKALNQQTNEQQQVTTNETGYYEFALLRPGHYRLTVEATGFE